MVEVHSSWFENASLQYKSDCKVLWVKIELVGINPYSLLPIIGPATVMHIVPKN